MDVEGMGLGFFVEVKLGRFKDLTPEEVLTASKARGRKF